MLVLGIHNTMRVVGVIKLNHMIANMMRCAGELIAQGIVKAIAKRRDVVYLPAFWQLIMFIIRSIPERIFKKLRKTYDIIQYET